MLRVEERLDGMASKVLVVRQMAVSEVEIIAKERRQRADKEDVVGSDALWQRGGAVLDVVEQRELPERERAAQKDGAAV